MLGNGQNLARQKITMNKQRILAKITGYALVLMAIIAGFSFGFAYTKFIDPSQLEFAQRNLTEHIQLYKFMLLGIVVVLLLDILVAWTILKIYLSGDLFRTIKPEIQLQLKLAPLLELRRRI
jgi:hypothetical protein